MHTGIRNLIMYNIIFLELLELDFLLLLLLIYILYTLFEDMKHLILFLFIYTVHGV
jgi:hypothetical protein